MINGYANKSSLLLFAATGRKIRQLPRNTGATSLGVCERNNEVISLTRQFVQRVGYRGIIDVGWRFDERDGRYKLLDFNPRIGATFRLFAHDDLDVVRAHYLDIMERTVDNTVVPDGRIWINEAADVFSAAGSLRTGDLSVKGYFRSLQQVNEPAWLAVDDFVPGMLMVWATLKRLLLYGLRRWRRAAGGSGYPRNSTLR